MQSKNISLILILLTICIVIYALLSNLGEVEFHPDESLWIGTSDSFEAFLKMEFNSSTWDISYWTLTQPPITRYIIGFFRYMGGYQRPDLNQIWNFNRGNQYNIRNGAMPSDGLLWWSRLPMAALACASILLVFMMLNKTSDFFAGYIWIGLILLNPYFFLHLRRAMGESPLLFFTIITLFLSAQGLRSAKANGINDKKIAITYIGLAGIASGLAWASKLNGATLIVSNIMTSILLAYITSNNRKDKIKFSILFSTISGLLSIATFVAVNPFLWPAPVQRTQMMFENRIKEMEEQSVTYSGSYMDPKQRVDLIPARVFSDYASLKSRLVLNMGLFIFGVYVVIKSAWETTHSGKGETFYIPLFTISFFTSVPIVFSSLDWDRYYLFPVFFTTLIIAIALARIATRSIIWSPKFYDRDA